MSGVMTRTLAILEPLAPDLLAAASDIAAISSASPLFDRVHARSDLRPQGLHHALS